MSGPSSDRNLLLGIVALQMDFISRDAMIGAMHQWTIEKSKPLSEILVANGALDPADRAVLENLVERHIARHGGDPEQSLSSLEIVSPARETLAALDDSDLQHSLSKVGTHTRAAGDSDPDLTGSWSAPGEAVGGRYRILHLHDHGGLGNVFLARDGEVNREVALKQLKEQIATDRQSRARFVFEAEITGNLEHPGVVPVYGRGVYADGRPYYAMRFVRGDNLKVAVDRFHKDPALKSDSGARHREFQKLLRRFLVVCETMAYVHSRGVLHRDINPRNILLGPYGETLIVDWGLAKVVGHAEQIEPSDATLRPPSSSDVQPTQAGSRVGTPSYMSPEQARGEVERLGPATDIYSLGATLYYMLAAKPPFTEDDVPEVLRKVERGEFLPPREVRHGVDRGLDAICLKAMALKAEDRYPTSRAMADDLDRWLADQPVTAFPEPLAIRAMRWLRRRKQFVATAATLLVLILIGLAIHDLRLGQEQVRTKLALGEAARFLGMTRATLREQLMLATYELGRFPNFESVREKLCVDALEIYDKLLASYPTDPDIRFETAEVYRILSASRRRTGQLDSALASYQKSIDLFKGLVDHPSRGKAALHGLSQEYIDRGELYRMNGGNRSALENYTAAIECIERLKNKPDSVNDPLLIAGALIDRAEALTSCGKLTEALRDSDQAIDSLEPTDKSGKPPADIALWYLGMAIHDRAVAMAEIGDWESAEKSFRRAIEVVGRIPTNSLHHDDSRLVRAVTFRRLAELVLKAPARHDEAANCLKEAIPTLEALVKDRRDIPVFREELAVSLCCRSELNATLGQLHKAAQDCEAAERALRDLQTAAPLNPQYASLLGRTAAASSRIAHRRTQTGQAQTLLEEAIDHMERAIKLDPDRQLDRNAAERLKRELKLLRGRIDSD